MKSQNIFERIGWPSTESISIGCKFPHINIRGQEDIVEMSDHINDETGFVLESIQERFMDLINGEGYSAEQREDEIEV